MAISILITVLRLFLSFFIFFHLFPSFCHRRSSSSLKERGRRTRQTVPKHCPKEKKNAYEKGGKRWLKNDTVPWKVNFMAFNSLSRPSHSWLFSYLQLTGFFLLFLCCKIPREKNEVQKKTRIHITQRAKSRKIPSEFKIPSEHKNENKPTLTDQIVFSRPATTQFEQHA